MANPSVSCLCWAYNESALIEAFLIRLNDFLKSAAEDYEIVIVDDASTDDTKAKIKAIQIKIPQIVLVENESNLNVGLCLRRAIQFASKDIVFWQTVDWAYDISRLKAILELLNRYDVAAGSRAASFLKNSPFWQHPFRLFHPKYLSARSDTLFKGIMSTLNYLVVRLFFGVPMTDFQNISFYPRKMIQSFQYESRSSFSNPEGLIKAYWQGARIIEVPIMFSKRTAGKAKGTKLKAIGMSLCDISYLWFRWMILKRFDFKKRGTVHQAFV